MNLNVTVPPQNTIETALCDFVQAPLNEAQNERALHVLRLSLLDWISVGVAGVDEPVAGIVRGYAVQDGGREECAVFGSDRKLPARAAALVNGTTSHALDYDDTHFAFLGHPSVAVFPAALALSERSGADGGAFLESALVGVETACRVGQWLGRPHYEAGFHQTATSGSFGAAAACSRLLGLDAGQTGHALGLASTKASGLKSQFGTMGKPYHAGLAAANGVEAALLAAAGFVSNPEGLSGTQGFAETHGAASGFAPDPSLGRDFLFERVQHKFHACCHGTHAMLEALGQLKGDSGLTLDNVDSLTVTVHPRFLKVCNIPDPATGLEAKFSFRQTAAMCLAGIDTSSLESFSDGVCSKPNLTAFRDRVMVSTDASLSDGETRVHVLTKTGGKHVGHHDIDAEVPLEVRETKVRGKAGSLLGEARAEAIWTRINQLGTSGQQVSLGYLLADDQS